MGGEKSASAAKGTSTGDEVPLRLMTAAAATTVAPHCLATSIVSRVEPPVVSTSSTMTTRSPASREKPRRSVSTPSARSAKIARTPSARATSWPMMRPPSAGDSTTVAFAAGSFAASARPQASASAGCCSTSAHCR